MGNVFSNKTQRYKCNFQGSVGLVIRFLSLFLPLLYVSVLLGSSMVSF